MLDLHVPAEVSLQVELTSAVRTLEGLTASVEMHVAQQVVHSVEGLATYLEKTNKQFCLIKRFISKCIVSNSSEP